MVLPFDKIVCISFIGDEKGIQRRLFQNNQYKQLGINVEFYNAIDFAKVFVDNKITITRRYEIACLLSHYTVVKQALLLGAKSILVLEDDTCFLNKPELFEKYFLNLPQDWNYIKFATLLTDFKNKGNNLFDVYNYFNNLPNDKLWVNLKELPQWFNSNCAAAYAMNVDAMEMFTQIVELNGINTGLIWADTIPYFYRMFKESPLNSYTTKDPLILPQCSLFNRKPFKKDGKIIFNCCPQSKFIDVENFIKPTVLFKSTINHF